MSEHPSLALIKKPAEKQFKETLQNFSVEIEHLTRKYEELKETDLTVNTLTELSTRLNMFEQKLDSLISAITENIQSASAEVELMAFLKQQQTKK